MATRIITSVIGLLVFFGVVISHRFVVYLALGVLTVGMLYEMYQMLDVKKIIKTVGFISAAALFMCTLLGNLTIGIYSLVAIFMIAMVLLHTRCSCREIFTAATVTLFIAGSIATLVLTRYEFDKISLVLPFVIAWLTDTGAYFTGSMIGNHKLVPKISPKKTVEGAVGGLVFAMVGGVAYAWIMNGFKTDVGVAAIFAVIGIVGSVISQLGDLIASCIKRDCKKKDYGSILPGHGGIMDRFDSVLFVSPFIYFALTYFGF